MLIIVQNVMRYREYKKEKIKIAKKKGKDGEERGDPGMLQSASR